MTVAGHTGAQMSKIESVAIERDRCQGSLPEWSEALCTYVGRMPSSSWAWDLTKCVPRGGKGFAGFIECVTLGDVVLAKVATSTPHDLTFALHHDEELASPAPLVVMFQTSGTCRVEHQNLLHPLAPGDWCLLDVSGPMHISSSDAGNENLTLRLERPSDPEFSGLIARSAAHRWRGVTGVSRILHATLTEAFGQMSSLRNAGEAGLGRLVPELVWTAVRERLEAPQPLLHQDLQRARLKTLIESQLADPELAVDAIAAAARISVRSIHRAFADDPAGSVSNYIWRRRLTRCAADLRDHRQASRPITDICMSWGFNSTSHFSRLFREHFGLSPREYRLASEHASVARVLAA
jgi:AraC-like DNA-binding protein